MWKRLTFGPLMIAVLVGLVWLDGYLGGRPLPGDRVVLGHANFPPGTIVFVICLLLTPLAAKELAGVLIAKGVLSSRTILTLSSAIGLAASCLIPSTTPAIDAVAIVASAGVVVLVMSLLSYSHGKNTKGVVQAVGGSLLAFIYLGLMFGFILAIRREHSVWILLWILLVIKACDTGAYFTGKAVGKHKLILWLSPGKTWEGLFGGIALSVAAAWGGSRLLELYANVNMPALPAIILAGFLFAVVGQAGDLVMSLFKRDAGLKDSGSTIPGFGGILDVLDSPLLVAPLAFWWLKWAMPGA
jgi:phosphatidate cytidylyltransferase